MSLTRVGVPVWLTPFWTPQLVSIGRCSRCLRVYRDIYGRGAEFACETCPGRVFQWKRCSKCSRWKAADAYWRSRRGRGLHCECKRCHSIAVVAKRAAMFAADPVWAESMRKRHREYLKRTSAA